MKADLLVALLVALHATFAWGQQGYQGSAPACWSFDLVAALGVPNVTADWALGDILAWPPNYVLDGSPARFMYITYGGVAASVDLRSRTLKWALAWSPPDDEIEIMSDGRPLSYVSTTGSIVTWLQLNESLRMLYVAGRDSSVHAIDIDSGREVWRYQHYSRAGLYLNTDGERVYTGTGGFSDVALNATTGELVWSRKYRRWPTASSVVQDGVLVRMDATNYIYGINASTGATLWKAPTVGQPGEGPALGAAYSKEVGAVFVRDDSGIIYAIDLVTGRLRWQIVAVPDAPAGGQWRPALTVGAGLVVIKEAYSADATGRASAFAFNQTTGALAWRRDDSVENEFKTACYNVMTVTPEGPFVMCTWARADNGALDSRLVAYDANGTEVWSAATGFRQLASYSRIAYDSAAGLRYLLDASGTLVALGTNADLACRGTSFIMLPPSPPAPPPSPPLPPSPPSSTTRTTGGQFCWQNNIRALPYSTPATDGVHVYQRATVLLQASDPTTGNVKWRYWCGDGGIQGTNVVVGDGVIYTGCADGRVHALDAATGRPKWVTTTATEGFSVVYPGFGLFAALHEGLLYVGGPDNHVYALNATDGRVAWAYAVEDLRVTTGQSVGVAGGVLYTVAGPQLAAYGGPASAVLALNATTGEELWSRPLGFNVELEGEVVITADGLFIFPTNNGELRAYSAGADGGDAVWSVIISTSFMTAISYFDGIIYAGDGKGVVRAVAVSDQRILWETPLQPLVDELVPVPSSTKMDMPFRLHDGRLYVATNQGMVVLNVTNGAVLWNDGMVGRVGGAPIIIDHGGAIGVQMIYPIYATFLVSTVTGACPSHQSTAITPASSSPAVQQPSPPPPSPPPPSPPASIMPPPPSPSACAACVAACNASSGGGEELAPRTLHLALGLRGTSYKELLASPRAQLRLAAAVAKVAGGTLGPAGRVQVAGLEAVDSAVVVRLAVSGLAADAASVSSVAAAFESAALSGALQSALAATKEPPLTRAGVRTLVVVAAP